MNVLDALEATRVAVQDWQREMEECLEAAQAEAMAARSALKAAQAELAQTREELQRRHDEISHNEERSRQAETQVKRQGERNHNLRSELLELYRDLRADDLPTLILRVSMNLAGAENGLYTDANGDSAIAAIGLDNLPPAVEQGLYNFTKRVIRDNAPVVCNDEQELPHGSTMVNLAALPVAVQGECRGAILVSNKRSGPFTDEDTDLLLSVGNHAGVALENRRLHGALADAYLSTIAVLADAIEAKDPYTRGHCEGVAGVAVQVAKRLGWQGEALEHIRYAALLHDIGKIGVPDGILLKPGRLLPEEYQVIQRHAAIGSDLVGRVPSLAPIAPIILHHHERMDGSGYPDGLKGDEILMGSRIIGAVDAFDAMTTSRPYREPVSQREALEEMRRCAGTQFDPQVVTLVAEVLSEAAILSQQTESGAVAVLSLA